MSQPKNRPDRSNRKRFLQRQSDALKNVPAVQLLKSDEHYNRIVKCVQERPNSKTIKTPETVNYLCELIAGGCTIKHAASLIGITPQTVWDWCQRDPETAEALSRAEAANIASHALNIEKQANVDWRASAWWLERRHFKHFGPKQDLNVNATVASVQLDAGALDKIASAWSKAKEMYHAQEAEIKKVEDTSANV